MRKIKILFFAADPLAVLSDKRAAALQLGKDVQEILERVKNAPYAALLEFKWYLAARTRDFARSLRESRPTIVHFSGHGDSKGLVVNTEDGHGAQHVEGAALKRLFEVFPNSVRLVVLSACYSTPQAEAIAEAVGCAIGTPGQITDDDAIEFNAAFYCAIASGESVQRAFDQAKAEIGLRPPLGTRPELIVRNGLDPSRVFLVPRFGRVKRATAGVSAVLLAAVLAVSCPPPPPPPSSAAPPRGVQLGDCGAPLTRSAMVEHGPAGGAVTSGSSEPAANLAAAKALCAAGNYEDAFPLFEQAAQAGNLEAEGLVGIAHMSGEGTHLHPELGVKLLREAASKGDVRSMLALAAAYENGYGVKSRSLRWAKHWLLKAVSEAGDAEAMRRLGVIYRDERSDSALQLLSKAVDAGSVDARVDLGEMYEKGIQVTMDTAQAILLYRSAAQNLSARGMFTLGRAYERGFGVPQSHVHAHRLYRQAACSGSADAMNAIGAQYQQGLGVPADREEAIRWFRLAEATGSDVGAGNLNALKAPEHPRRWKGPVGKVLGWLGLSESQPRLECKTPVSSHRG